MKYLVLLLSLLSASVAYSNPVPEFPFVIVTEHLEKQIKPDVATIAFSVIAFDKNSEKAMGSVVKTGVKILELLKANGIPLSRLESRGIDKTAKRAGREHGYSLEILGYAISQNFKITLNDLDKYSGVVNELASLDGVQAIEALFKTTKEDSYKEEMIQELSKMARMKADLLAGAQSRKVKTVYGITTQSSFGEAYAVFSLEYDPRNVEFSMASVAYGENLIMNVPEYIEVKQHLTAIYELQ
jgi:uncharacterized protein